MLTQSEVLLITISENIAYEDYAQYLSVVDYRTAVFVHTLDTETTKRPFVPYAPFQRSVATAETCRKAFRCSLFHIAYRAGMDSLLFGQTGFFVAVVIQEDNTDVKIGSIFQSRNEMREITVFHFYHLTKLIML